MSITGKVSFENMCFYAGYRIHTTMAGTVRIVQIKQVENIQTYDNPVTGTHNEAHVRDVDGIHLYDNYGTGYHSEHASAAAKANCFGYSVIVVRKGASEESFLVLPNGVRPSPPRHLQHC